MCVGGAVGRVGVDADCGSEWAAKGIAPDGATVGVGAVPGVGTLSVPDVASSGGDCIGAVIGCIFE